MTSQQIYHDLTFYNPLLQSASWVRSESLPGITQDEMDEFTEVNDSSSNMFVEAIATLPCYMTEKKIKYTACINVSPGLENTNNHSSAILTISPEYVKYSKQHYPFKVNLCELSCNGSVSKRWIEIWNNDVRHMVYDTTSLHGEYYLKDALSGTCLSPDGTMFMYLADSEPTKLQNTRSSNPLCGHEEFNYEKLKKTYAHRQDWGEQYGETRKHPNIILVNIPNMTVNKIQLEDDSLHPCQMQFYPSMQPSNNNYHLLFIAYSTLSRQNGLCYCSNRP